MDELITIMEVTGLKQHQLALLLGTSQPQISRWLRGQAPKWEMGAAISALAERVTSEGFDKRQLGKVEDADSAEQARKQIMSMAAPHSVALPDPNLVNEIDINIGMGGGGLAAETEVVSGNGITFHREAVRDTWRFPDWMLARMNVKAKNIAAFPALGDSMEPTISDGDIVFIDTRHRTPSPPGIYALADEFGGLVLKRLEVVSRPNAEEVEVKIISDNPLHGAKTLLLSEIFIIGRLIGRFTT